MIIERLSKISQSILDKLEAGETVTTQEMRLITTLAAEEAKQARAESLIKLKTQNLNDDVPENLRDIVDALNQMTVKARQE